MYTVEKCTYTVYTVHIYPLQVCMPTSGIAIHYVGWGCLAPKPQEVHSFGWEFWDRFVWLFQECNPGVKADLPV